jgi:hypothetical protein
MSKLGVFLLLVICCGFVQAQTWRELSSLFGVAKPFRQGHAAIMTTFGRMASFSGLDNTLTGSRQVSRYNYLSNSQLQILPDVPANEKPSRQLSGYATWGDQYLVQYGGLVGGQNSKELIIFDVNAGSWVPNVTTFLTNPTFNIENHFVFGTESPSAAIDQTGFLWLFGGRSTILQLNFLTRVNLNTYEFIQVNLTTTTNQPSRRYASAMAYYSNALWLFGGRQGLGSNPVQDLAYFNDLKKFNTGTNSWSAPTATGSPPSARAYMATCILKDGITWILFGGLNDASGAGTAFDDVYRFDLSSANGAWTAINAPNPPDPGRFKLVAVHLGWDGEDSVLFHGGSDLAGGSLNNFFKLEIVTNNTSPNPPPADLDQDADVADQNSGTSTPPPSSSSVSSSEPPIVLPEDEAASALTSWLSLLWV